MKAEEVATETCLTNDASAGHHVVVDTKIAVDGIETIIVTRTKSDGIITTHATDAMIVTLPPILAEKVLVAVVCRPHDHVLDLVLDLAPDHDLIPLHLPTTLHLQVHLDTHRPHLQWHREAVPCHQYRPLVRTTNTRRHHLRSTQPENVHRLIGQTTSTPPLLPRTRPLHPRVPHRTEQPRHSSRQLHLCTIAPDQRTDTPLPHRFIHVTVHLLNASRRRRAFVTERHCRFVIDLLRHVIAHRRHVTDLRHQEKDLLTCATDLRHHVTGLRYSLATSLLHPVIDLHATHRVTHDHLHLAADHQCVIVLPNVIHC
jgi:hypothetical protein